MIRNKKAVGRAATTAATNTLLPKIYRHATAMSTAALSAPASRGTNHAGDAVGALLLYVLARPLPLSERAFCWALAERWLAELVDRNYAGLKEIVS
jgi:hypothetical protein